MLFGGALGILSAVATAMDADEAVRVRYGFRRRGWLLLSHLLIAKSLIGDHTTVSNLF